MSQSSTQNKGKDKATEPEVIDLLSTSPSESEQEPEALLGSKAILMKAELEASIDPLAPVDAAVMEKVSPQNNSTNLHIVHLRDTMGLSWAAIATKLNEEAAKEKEKGPAIKSEASASTTANTPAADAFDEKLVYCHYLRTKHRLPPTTIPKRTAGPSSAPAANFDRGRPAFMIARGKRTSWDDELDVFLVEAVKEARDNFWGTVAQRMREKTDGKKEPKPEECQGRYLDL